VEKVVAHCDKPRREVLIHWANTEAEEASWEPLGSDDMRNNGVVKAYCVVHGLRIPARRRRTTASNEDNRERVCGRQRGWLGPRDVERTRALGVGGVR